MTINGKHVAILVDDYFEQAEFEEPLSALKDAGAEVTIISTSKKVVQGMQHAEKGDKFTVDLNLESASSDDYDGLILPGGVINADGLRMNQEAQKWATDFLNSNRPLAAICHAPWLLVSADNLEGRRLTSYWTIQDDIQNAGAEWVDEPVVIDGNLITSRQPDDLPAFNEAIIKELSHKASVASASAADLPTIGSQAQIEDDIRLRALGYSPDMDGIDKEAEIDILADTDTDAFYPSNMERES